MVPHFKLLTGFSTARGITATLPFYVEMRQEYCEYIDMQYRKYIKLDPPASYASIPKLRLIIIVTFLHQACT